MDNYLGLIEEIKKTISLKLAQKAEKQKELLREQGKLEQNLNRKKDITDNLKENNKNLETLKSYQNKIVPLKALQESLMYLIKNLLKDAKNNKISLILLMIFIGMFILEPLGVGSTFVSIFTITSVITSIYLTKDIYKLRKKHSIYELETEKQTLEDELLFLLANINANDREISSLQGEISELEEQLRVLNQDYINLEQIRTNIIEKLVSENDLNSTFKETEYSDIIKRIKIIRTKPKKHNNSLKISIQQN